MLNIPAEILTELAKLPCMMSTIERHRIAELAAEVEPAHQIVEVGGHRGGSAAWLAHGAMYGKNAHVLSLDVWREPKPTDTTVWAEKQRGALQAFQATLTQLGLHNRVTGLQTTAPMLASMMVQSIGGLLIDGNHNYAFVKMDFEALSPFVVPGGWVFFHDYIDYQDAMKPTGVRKYVDEVVQPSGLWTSPELLGLSAVVRKRGLCPRFDQK